MAKEAVDYFGPKVHLGVNRQTLPTSPMRESRTAIPRKCLGRNRGDIGRSPDVPRPQGPFPISDDARGGIS